MHETARIRECQRLSAKLKTFLGSVRSDIAGTGNQNLLSLDCVFMLSQHISEEKYRAIAGCFCPHFRTTELKPLTRQNSNEAIRHPFVLTKHIADFAATNTNITRRDVGIRANMPNKLGHKGLAKPHNLVIGFAFGVEVSPPFTATHR